MTNDNDRFQTRVDDSGRTYIDMTPTWQEILPTWLLMLEQAYRGNCNDPDLIIANAKTELRTMAVAADKWNAHCKLRDALEASAKAEGQ